MGKIGVNRILFQTKIFDFPYPISDLIKDLIAELSRAKRASAAPWVRRDTAHFDSEDDYRTGCRNVSHCQQQ